jgi:hypothetical protein
MIYLPSSLVYSYFSSSSPPEARAIPAIKWISGDIIITANGISGISTWSLRNPRSHFKLLRLLVAQIASTNPKIAYRFIARLISSRSRFEVEAELLKVLAEEQQNIFSFYLCRFARFFFLLQDAKHSLLPLDTGIQFSGERFRSLSLGALFSIVFIMSKLPWMLCK